ncbi:MAG: hypothetical protein LBV23_11955 [Deltaproteobacteria bacterium]|jgi:DNA polymerase-3 subunit delta|nr:hypothetical protein [Deltaproteobacteria bacterium]
MNVSQFEEEIVSASRRGFYVVVGGDPFATQRCLQACKAAVAPAFFQFNFRLLRLENLNKEMKKGLKRGGDNSGWARLAMEAFSNAFGQPPRILVIKVSETEKIPEEGLDTLIELKSSVNPQLATIILIHDSPPDARLKFYKDIAKDGLEVDGRAPLLENLPSWLIERFKEKGVRLTFDGARALIERLGQNVGALLGEVEKLSIYPGAEKPLTAKEVSELVSFGPTAEIYDLAAPVALGNLNKACSALLDLLESYDAFPLLYSVGSHFKRLRLLKAIVMARGGRMVDSDLTEGAQISYGQLNYLKSQLNLWTEARLKKALEAVEEAHLAIVTGRAPTSDLILEELSIKLCLLANKVDD